MIKSIIRNTNLLKRAIELEWTFVDFKEEKKKKEKSFGFGC